jgi:electron transfer flavoprotein beta subunit
MPNVITCYKWVVDEADIRINPDLTVDFSKAKGKISDYDRNAIEAAIQAAVVLGGEAFGLTFGTENANKSLKDALSRGLEQVFFVKSNAAAEADGRVTARTLAAAVKKIDDVGLVLCAEGASDTYARQTAPRIGAALDWPVVTSVSKIEIAGNMLSAIRKLDDCEQTVKVELPCVVAVLPEINSAPIPGLKAVLAAGKKPTTTILPDELGIDYAPKTQVTELKGYKMNRKSIVITEGEATAKVNALVAALRKEGVV